MKTKDQSGFVMIALLLAVVIIAILYVKYYEKGNNVEPSTAETGQNAQENARLNNNRLIQDNIETQNTLNSIGN